MVGFAPNLFKIQEWLGVEPPLFIMLSMVKIKGYVVALSRETLKAQYEDEITPIDRSELLISEIMIEKFDVDFGKVIRPVFDAVWNAGGEAGSPNYDYNGKWVGRS